MAQHLRRHGFPIQHIVGASNTSSLEDNETVSATELDSHADSPVVGKYAKFFELTGKAVNVSGFISNLGKPLRVPVPMIVNTQVMCTLW